VIETQPQQQSVMGILLVEPRLEVVELGEKFVIGNLDPG
jgi:hypothetical protein